MDGHKTSSLRAHASPVENELHLAPNASGTPHETEDPALRGEMKITIELADKDSGTEVIGVHEGVPPGLRDSDNEVGWRMAVARHNPSLTKKGTFVSLF